MCNIVFLLTMVVELCQYLAQVIGVKGAPLVVCLKYSMFVILRRILAGEISLIAIQSDWHLNFQILPGFLVAHDLPWPPCSAQQQVLLARLVPSVLLFGVRPQAQPDPAPLGDQVDRKLWREKKMVRPHSYFYPVTKVDRGIELW